MGTEIERKFLVVGDDWKMAEPTLYIQGYLNRDKFRTVRVRIAGDQAWLTIKGATIGITRAEYEYIIPVSDAEEMLKLSDGPLVEKKRWRVLVDDVTWEIDEFLGENAGLIVAEIELDDENQTFNRPAWVGTEVTQDARYYNSNLASHPFKTWDRAYK